MNAAEVRKVVENWLANRITGVNLGLPEYDDRKGVWCVALVTQHNGMEPVGEVRVLNGEVIFSSNLELVAKRIKHVEHKPKRESRNKPIHSVLYVHASYLVMQLKCWLIIRLILFNLFSLLRHTSMPNQKPTKAKDMRTT